MDFTHHVQIWKRGDWQLHAGFMSRADASEYARFVMQHAKARIVDNKLLSQAEIDDMLDKEVDND